jgi:hypothetical protein
MSPVLPVPSLFNFLSNDQSVGNLNKVWGLVGCGGCNGGLKLHS